MLSRVAEQVYWIARYIERAENSARLVNACSNQMLDLPKGLTPGWRQLVEIIGGNSGFEKKYQTYNEQNTVSFLVADSFS
ncbi:MAG TPA: alpha-E domain-containing protein, partial [Candidatus Manganitrophaceae bacterium]|nr:alpha-E domain-containing protein [Candidatus Manganitrophaceae bacterium]